MPPPPAPIVAQLPGIAQVQGGLNALNQAAFGNPVAPTSQFGIVPTAPAGIPTYQTPSTTRPAGGGGGTPRGLPGSPLGTGDLGRGQNFMDTIRQRLGQSGGPRGAAQGGPGVGSTAAKEAIDRFTASNVAASPNLATALRTAAMFTGPMGFASGLANMAMGDPLGSILGSTGPFNMPGLSLSQDAIQSVRDAFYGALNPTASNIQQALAKANAMLTTQRALSGMGGIKAPGTVAGPGTYGSISTPMGPEITANFASPGFAPAIASAMGSGGPQGGFGGGSMGGGGTNPGGLGGGVGGGPGANRSM